MTKSIRRNKTFKTKKSRKNKKNLKLKGGGSEEIIRAFFKSLGGGCNTNTFILNEEDIKGIIQYFKQQTRLRRSGYNSSDNISTNLMTKLDNLYNQALSNSGCKIILDLNDILGTHFLIGHGNFNIPQWGEASGSRPRPRPRAQTVSSPYTQNNNSSLQISANAYSQEQGFASPAGARSRPGSAAAAGAGAGAVASSAYAPASVAGAGAGAGAGAVASSAYAPASVAGAGVNLWEFIPTIENNQNFQLIFLSVPKATQGLGLEVSWRTWNDIEIVQNTEKHGNNTSVWPPPINIYVNGRYELINLESLFLQNTKRKRYTKLTKINTTDIAEFR